MKSKNLRPDAETGTTTAKQEKYVNGKTAMYEKLIFAANDILVSEKPFGCVKVFVNGNLHIFGIMMWGEHLKDVVASTLYYSEDENFNFQKQWDFIAEEVFDIFVKRKAVETMIKGHHYINFLPVKTEAEAKEYIFHTATMDEGYLNEFEVTI